MHTSLALYWNGIELVAASDNTPDVWALALLPDVIMLADYFRRPSLEVARDILALRRRGVVRAA
jgi:hypothetical protein